MRKINNNLSMKFNITKDTNLKIFKIKKRSKYYASDEVPTPKDFRKGKF